MALLEVDEVATDPRGQLRGGEVLVLDPFQIAVGQQRVRGIDESAGRFVACQRIENRIVSRQQRPSKTEPSRMRQLQAEQQIAVVTECCSMCCSAIGQHLFDRGRRTAMQPQLSWVHPRVIGNRSRFAPDQLRAATAESDVAAEGQLIRQTIERPVATLHRLNRPAIADRSATDLNRLKHDRQIVGHRDVRKTQSFRIGHDIGGSLVLEISGH